MHGNVRQFTLYTIDQRMKCHRRKVNEVGRMKAHSILKYYMSQGGKSTQLTVGDKIRQGSLLIGEAQSRKWPQVVVYVCLSIYNFISLAECTRFLI